MEQTRGEHDMTTGYAMVIDLAVVVFCAWVFFHLPGRAIYHPAVLYWLFHIGVVTLRLWQWHYGVGSARLSSVFPTLTDADMVRASIASDFGLLMFAVGVVIGSLKRVRIEPGDVSSKSFAQANRVTTPIFAAIGLYALLKWLPLPGRPLVTGIWNSAQGTGTWLLQSCVLWREQDANRQFARLLDLSILLLLGLQLANGTRANLVLSVVIIVVLVMLQRRERWPSFFQIVILCLIVLFFFVGKPFAAALSRTGSFQDAVQATVVYRQGSGVALDLDFLDMQAAYMKAIADYGRYQWGRTYLAAILFFIPRAWWASKPNPTVYRALYSTRELPISTYGVTPNLVGDLCVNFGYVGMALGMIVLGVLFTYLYRTCVHPNAGIARWVLLAVMTASLIQIYRDGLASMITWPFLAFLPMTVSGLLGLAKKRWTAGLYPGRHRGNARHSTSGNAIVSKGRETVCGESVSSGAVH